MAQIVVPTSKRLAEMEALSKQLSTLQEKLEAKADFVAMMTDVDLSEIEEDDEEGMSDGAQQDV